MENTRAVLLAAVLAALPVAAYSQGTPAPADAFLYIIWPPDGATVKGAFWCRFGLRNMGVTQAGSNAANSGHHHLLIDVNEPLDPNEPIPQDNSRPLGLQRKRRAARHGRAPAEDSQVPAADSQVPAADSRNTQAPGPDSKVLGNTGRSRNRAQRAPHRSARRRPHPLQPERGCAKDKNLNLILIGTIPAPHSKEPHVEGRPIEGTSRGVPLSLRIDRAPSRHREFRFHYVPTASASPQREYHPLASAGRFAAGASGFLVVRQERISARFELNKANFTGHPAPDISRTDLHTH